jgi:hypothetical protein
MAIYKLVIWWLHCNLGKNKNVTIFFLENFLTLISTDIFVAF